MRLIDADALKENARKWLPMSRETVVFNLFDLIDNLVNNMPTIDPVKHGKWEPFDLTWGRSVYACTVCGEAIEVPTENGKPIFDYCPNCGAKMDGGEE